MKQHITTEQLWELSKWSVLEQEKTWDEIVEFNTLMGYEWNLTPEENEHYTFNKCCEDSARWTTIGKMIELIEQHIDTMEPDDGGWTIGIIINSKFNAKHGGYDVSIKNIKAIELCDALWEAVKYVLKEMNDDKAKSE